MYEYDKARRERLKPKQGKPVAKEGHKICNKCKIEKPLTDYHNSKSSKDGHKGECKECACNRVKKYQQLNTDKIKAKKDAYRSSEEGKATERAYNRKRYEENKEDILAKHKEWEQKNREYRLQYHKEYNAAHKEERREYREANKEHIKETEANWRRNN